MYIKGNTLILLGLLPGTDTLQAIFMTWSQDYGYKEFYPLIPLLGVGVRGLSVTSPVARYMKSLWHGIKQLELALSFVVPFVSYKSSLEKSQLPDLSDSLGKGSYFDFKAKQTVTS